MVQVHKRKWGRICRSKTVRMENIIVMGGAGLCPADGTQIVG